MSELSKFIIGDAIAQLKDSTARNKIGDLDNLNTQEKENLVASINEVDAIVKSIQGSLYPVGHVIFNDDCDTESKVINLYGGSHWIQIKDEFILAKGDIYTEDGGSMTATLSENNIPQHRHNLIGNFTTGNESQSHTHEFTTGESGQHYHTFSSTLAQASGSSYMPQIYSGPSAGDTQTSQNGIHTHSGTTRVNGSNHNHSLSINTNTGYTGLGEAFNIIPKNTTTYVWRRVE